MDRYKKKSINKKGSIDNMTGIYIQSASMIMKQGLLKASSC